MFYSFNCPEVPSLLLSWTPCTSFAFPSPHLLFFSSLAFLHFPSILLTSLRCLFLALLLLPFTSLPFSCLSLLSYTFLSFSLLSLLPYTSLAFPSPILFSSSLPSLPLPSFAFHLTYNIINICIVWRVYKQNFTLAQTIAKIP